MTIIILLFKVRLVFTMTPRALIYKNWIDRRYKIARDMFYSPFAVIYFFSIITDSSNKEKNTKLSRNIAPF